MKLDNIVAPIGYIVIFLLLLTALISQSLSQYQRNEIKIINANKEYNLIFLEKLDRRIFKMEQQVISNKEMIIILRD